MAAQGYVWQRVSAASCCVLHDATCITPGWRRYTDEVRRVVKGCYEEVWSTLASHKDALWAGVAALAEHGEMLGAELRDVFDKHPPMVSCAMCLASTHSR